MRPSVKGSIDVRELGHAWARLGRLNSSPSGCARSPPGKALKPGFLSHGGVRFACVIFRQGTPRNEQGQGTNGDPKRGPDLTDNHGIASSGGRPDGRFSLHPENPILESRMHANVPVRFGRRRLDSLATKGLAAYLIARLWSKTGNQQPHNAAISPDYSYPAPRAGTQRCKGLVPHALRASPGPKRVRQGARRTEHPSPRRRHGPLVLRGGAAPARRCPMTSRRPLAAKALLSRGVHPSFHAALRTAAVFLPDGSAAP